MRALHGRCPDPRGEVQGWFGDDSLAPAELDACSPTYLSWGNVGLGIYDVEVE